MKTKYFSHTQKSLILALLFLPVIGFSQFAMEYQYVYNKPLTPMNYTFNNAHGGFWGITYAPKKRNYNIGLGYQVGFYGNKVQPMQFQSDSIMVSTKLRINNYSHSVFVYNKYHFNNMFENERLKTFIDARAGWSFFRTDLSIDDPENTDQCEALYSDILYRDNTWSVGAGLGAEYKISGLINPKMNEERGQAYLSISAGYVHGGKVSYMNVEKEGNTQSHHNHANGGSTNVDKTEYYTEWINTTTKVVHSHHTGYVYTSPIRMLELKVGFSIKF